MHYLSRSIAFFGFRNRRPGALKKEGHFLLGKSSDRYPLDG
jgi:hypothetical protein